MNNPPAFPSGNDVTLGDWRSHGHSGMTLRDYFAARAMAICPLRDLAEKSEWCYELADYMLEAREA